MLSWLESEGAKGDRVVIHQPDFLPWLGFFDRLAHADLWIVLDHVQFTSGAADSWIHRDKILSTTGPRWLTTGVVKAPLGTSINDMRLDPDPRWRLRHLRQVREAYRKSAWFAHYYQEVESLYNKDADSMVDFNLRGIDWLCRCLGIKCNAIRSSQLEPEGRANKMLVSLLQRVNARTYLSGDGARDYFEEKPFRENGIEVEWQQYQVPVYPQGKRDKFVSGLSALDALFWVGPAAARWFQASAQTK